MTARTLVASITLAVLGLLVWLALDDGGAPSTAADRAAPDSPQGSAESADLVQPSDVTPRLAEAPRAASERRPAADGTPADDGPLVVAVRTAAGLAVDDYGVRVRVEGLEPRDTETLWMRTGADGTARFERDDVTRVWAQDSAAALVVESSFKLPVHVETRIPPEAIPSEPVVLVVDMMRVVVRAETSDGEPWTRPMGLSVSPDDLHYMSTAGDPPRIGWVPRGRGYELRVYGCGLHEDAEEHFPAPGPDEVEREHVITLLPPVSGITARVVDPDGEPLPEKSQLEVLDRGRSGNGSRWTWVREDGRIEYPLKLGESAGRRFHFEFSPIEDASNGSCAKRVEFEVGPAGEYLDLGTIQLVERPLLVAGRMIAPEGVLLKSVGVRVDVRVGRDWVGHPVLDNCVFVADDGTFEVYGEDLPGPERLKVVALRSDFKELVSAGPRRFTPGARDVELRMVEPGAITAQLAPAIFGERRDAWLRLRIRPEGGGPEILFDDVRALASNPVLARKKLPPGLLRVERLAGEDGAPIEAWDDFVVRSGETTDLGVLAPKIEVSTLRLSIDAPQSSAIQRSAIQVAYGPAGTRPLRFTARCFDGVVDLPIGTEPIDALLYGTGCAPKLVEALQHDVEVRVERGRELEVRVRGSDEVAALLGSSVPEREPLLVLEPMGGFVFDALHPDLHGALTSTRDLPRGDAAETTVRMPLPPPGQYRVRLLSIKSGDLLRRGGHRRRPAPGVTLGGLVVEEGAEPETLEIDLGALLEAR